MSEPKLRIGPIMSTFMIGTALIYDGLKALIELVTFGFLGWLINPFINIWAFFTFAFWFSYLGVSFLKPGKMQGAKIAGMAAPAFLGLIPFVGDLPYWTSGVVSNIAAVYAEDLLEAITPEALGVMGKVLARFQKGPKPQLNAKTPPPIPTAKETTKDKEGNKGLATKTEPSRQVDWRTETETKVAGQKSPTRQREIPKMVDGVKPNRKMTIAPESKKETGSFERETAPAYQEFDQPSGQLVPTDIGEERPEDWPMAA